MHVIEVVDVNHVEADEHKNGHKSALFSRTCVPPKAKIQYHGHKGKCVQTMVEPFDGKKDFGIFIHQMSWVHEHQTPKKTYDGESDGKDNGGGNKVERGKQNWISNFKPCKQGGNGIVEEVEVL